MAAWDAAGIAEARRLFDAGHSGSEAAKLLGVSRGALFGIWRRQGFCRGRPSASFAHWRGRPAKIAFLSHGAINQGRGEGRQLPLSRRPSDGVSPVLPADPPLPPEVRPVTLLQLSEISDFPGHCRFVLGEPRGAATLFCGAGRERPPSPYCPFHMKLVAGEGTPSEQRASEMPAELR